MAEGSDTQEVDRLYSRRDYWYGRSRANRWPLWLSWLLAPTPRARKTCRELIQLKRSGVDV